MSNPRTPHALITGGSRGIGLAIARLLADNNHHITLLSRSPKNLESALSTLPQPPSFSERPPLKHSYIAGDIAQFSFWSSSAIGKQLGEAPDSKIDVLVNCAGLSQRKLFGAMSEGELRNVVDANLTGMMMGTRFLMRHRYIQGVRGRKNVEGKGNEVHKAPIIINVASLLGVQGGYGAVAYAASKAGVLGFTRALASETGAMGVRVNAIVPGYVETDMTKDLDQAAIINRIPLRRLGKPEEIASAALFLVQNEYAHNCVINLDGGLSAT